MNTKPSIWIRRILGVFLILYAMNQFFHFFPSGYGSMPEQARVFLDAVVSYLPILYVFEMIIGICLLFNKWTSLILIMLFPLTVAFLMFNFANWDIRDFWPAFIVAAANIYLVVKNREKYESLLD